MGGGFISSWKGALLLFFCVNTAFLLQVLGNHGLVLSRGLMVETPSIQQILGGHLSMITDSNEQKFLQDFTESKADTAGGRLARWLQPDRAVDPEASELVIPDEPVKTGVPSSFTIRTKDQDGKLVYVEGMKVEFLCVLKVLCCPPSEGFHHR